MNRKEPSPWAKTNHFLPAFSAPLRFSFLLVLISVHASGAEIIFDFTKEQPNETPTNFLSTVSGEDKPGLWKIIEAEVPSSIPSITPNAPPARRPVLAQLSRDLTDEHYPILVYTNGVFADFTFTTRLKCVSGVVEQMAGIVFRYQDEKNYYYVRASAKGNTFRFLKLVAGQRSAPIGPEMQIPAGVWHDLSVECRGNQINCFFDGKQAIPTLTDNSFSSGRIGFWTKSDSVSYFTESRLTYTPREPFVKIVLHEMKERYPRVEALKVFGKTRENPTLRIMASTDEGDLGKPGGDVEEQIFQKDSPFVGKLGPGSVVVTLPLHDRNGEVIAALRVEMKSFFGQTDNNAVSRALPIRLDMERRIVEAKDFF
ncbi:MAG TPA: family 16 glycoside hydrolase [Verrucomicrobiae bacterium]|jgi:hypothetical protein|nr:family 16 glycoside hydrolase [Verrucomicrobiae bacterium]